MLASPFRFDKELSPEDFERLGRLLLRWSHIDHMIANCLKLQLGLDEDQARLMIFPLSTELRLQRMNSSQSLKLYRRVRPQTSFKNCVR